MNLWMRAGGAMHLPLLWIRSERGAVQSGHAHSSKCGHIPPLRHLQLPSLIHFAASIAIGPPLRFCMQFQ